MTGNGHNRVRFGPFEADLRTHELWKEGIRLRLSGQPFQVLEMLLEKSGDLVTRDELRARMWPEDTFVDFSHGLNAAVNKLREALSDSADNPKYIETLPRRGYRFIALVNRGHAAPLPNSPEAPVPVGVSAGAASAAPAVAPTAESRIVPAVKRRRRVRPILIFGGVVATCFVLFIVGIFVIKRTKREEIVAPLRAASIARIPDPLTDPAFSPDGNEVAVRRVGRSPASSGIFVIRVGGDEMRQLTHLPTDCCPEFSPDGKSVAFSRLSEREFQIIVVPSNGGSERKVYSGPPRREYGEVAWSPDGRSLVFSGVSSRGTGSIFTLSLDTLESRQLTDPDVREVDWAPAYSPDGKYLAFLRSRNEGFGEDLFILTSEGDLRKVVSPPGRILGPPAWTADSHSIIYSSAAEGGPELWKVAVTGGRPTAIPEAGRNAWHPTVSRRGYRLAYQQMATMTSLWRIDLAKRNGQFARSMITRNDGKNEGPQLSPDGKRLAFMSDRSGSMEIWVSAADGSNPVQLSALGKTGTPRWSPDSKWIAFDCSVRGHGAIYIVNADGGEPRPLVQGEFENLVPSWSHDGKWIYFASDRAHDWQVWKAPLDGGPQERVTSGGGFAAWESSDGQYLYYAKTPFPNPDIWRVSVRGGPEGRIAPIVPRMWATWALTQNGIYFVPESNDNSPVVSFYDLGTQQVRHIVGLNSYPFWLSVSNDTQTILVDQKDRDESNVIVVENFH